MLQLLNTKNRESLWNEKSFRSIIHLIETFTSSLTQHEAILTGAAKIIKLVKCQRPIQTTNER